MELNADTSYSVQVQAENGETPSAWSTAGSGRISAAATTPGVTV